MYNSTAPGWTIFKTDLGPCGIAWTTKGFDRLVLPSETRADTEDELTFNLNNRPHTPNPPTTISDFIERIKHHLEGTPDNLANLPIDLHSATPFSKKVYSALRKIGPGCTASYGQLAALVGKPNAARAVGRAMGANPLPLIIPCHRVLPAGGGLGGFSAHGGTKLKEKLLTLEGRKTAKHR